MLNKLKGMETNKLIKIGTLGASALSVAIIAGAYTVFGGSDTAPLETPSYENIETGLEEEDFSSIPGHKLEEIGTNLGEGMLGEEGEGAYREVWYSLTEAEREQIKTGATSQALYQKVVSAIYAKEKELVGEATPTKPPQTEPNYNVEDEYNEEASLIDLKPVGEGTEPNVNENNGQLQTEEEVKDMQVNINTKGKDAKGVVTKADKKDVDINKILEGKTVVSGSSLKSKVYKQLDSLASDFIVELNKETADEVVNWIMNEYPNKLLISEFSYGKAEESNNSYLYIEIKYLLTKAQLNELNREVSKYVNTLNGTTNIRNTLTAINQHIADKATYTKSIGNPYSPYTLFKQGKGVCQAYTSYGKLILDALGYENTIATGVLNDEPHTWNVIKVDGENVHVDFTLADSKNSTSYIYITEENINKDRVIDSILF